MLRIPTYSTSAALGELPQGQIQYSTAKVIHNLAECEAYDGTLWDNNRFCCVEDKKLKQHWTCAPTTFGTAPTPGTPGSTTAAPTTPTQASIFGNPLVVGGLTAAGILAAILLSRRRTA